jgi:NitT/TauT family transport system substrate-binding protein
MNSSFSLSRILRNAVAAAAVLVMTLSTQPASAQEKVTFAWPVAINSGLAPFIFAQELGFFKEENLEFDVVVLQGSGIIIPQLMNGTIFTAFSVLEPLIISRQPGKPNFDFRFVYNIVRSSIWEVAVLEESKIKTFADLKGKSIGVGALTWGNVPVTKAALRASGLDPAAVQFIAVGVGVPAYDALRRGQIDALNLYDTMHISMESQGTKIRRLEYPSDFRGLASHGFPVTNKNIKEKPQLIERFGRAVTKGTVACEANIAACVEAFWKVYPNSRPTGDAAANLAKEIKVLEARVKNMTAFRAGEPRKLGAFGEPDWKSSIIALHAGGQIENTDIKINTLYTNQFVEAYNKFNREDVIKKAKAYKP